jgi:5-methylcytosine-specific restriction endonuclease McrA
MENKTMKWRILSGLLLVLLMAACAQRSEATDYQPASSDADLDEWAERYPAEYEDWAESNHGQAYLSGDENAPACMDCHADPASGEIETAAFRLEIPGRCARCHADEEMMSEHAISADVYETYLADYHGATIQYYHETSLDTWRYEAVCSDCHGSHAIYGPEEAESSVAPDNLLATCQTCHRSATENFATAFGHYRPARTPVSTAESPLIFWVKLFYQALIPVILGFMIAFVVLDFRHRRRKEADHGD